MDDVFNTPKEEQPAEVVQPEQVEVEGTEPTEQAESHGEPTAPETQKHVPLAALEAERKGRQDWKEKAIRFEEEAKQLRERLATPQTYEPQEPVDPVVRLHQEVVNERFNTSELLARQKYADLDEVVETFMAAAQQNPALAAQLQTQRHPWEFAYQEGQRMKAMQEIGTDPRAYRERLKAELLAELQQSPKPASAPLPQSLATARSAAGRSSGAFTGPPPIETLFNN